MKGPPILLNHDHTRAPIGHTEVESDGSLLVRFEGDGVTRAQFFDIFGDCGVKVLEFAVNGIATRDERERLIVVQILEWSRSNPRAEPG